MKLLPHQISKTGVITIGIGLLLQIYHAIAQAQSMTSAIDNHVILTGFSSHRNFHPQCRN